MENAPTEESTNGSCIYPRLWGPQKDVLSSGLKIRSGRKIGPAWIHVLPTEFSHQSAPPRNIPHVALLDFVTNPLLSALFITFCPGTVCARRWLALISLYPLLSGHTLLSVMFQISTPHLLSVGDGGGQTPHKTLLAATMQPSGEPWGNNLGGLQAPPPLGCVVPMSRRCLAANESSSCEPCPGSAKTDVEGGGASIHCGVVWCQDSRFLRATPHPPVL